MLDDTHADPLQYCPEGQEDEDGGVEEVTHADPLQYWPDGQEVEEGDPPLAQPETYSVEQYLTTLVPGYTYLSIAPLKYPLAILWQSLPRSEISSLVQPEVAELTHAVPFQYWPEGHVVEESDVDLQYPEPPPVGTYQY